MPPAVLRGLNRLRGQPLDDERLHQVARSLGADVPFFLLEGPALGRGIGDRLTRITLPADWFVLVNPGFPVSTAWVYASLQPPFVAPDETLLDRLAHEHPSGWLHNDLEAVTLSRYPELADLKQALWREGALGALMSGSGPTVFGMFHGGRCGGAGRFPAESRHRFLDRGGKGSGIMAYACMQSVQSGGGELKIFSGNANLPLAENICSYLEIPLGKIQVGRFSDGEITVEIKENVRGKDVFVIQPTCRPVNENLMELLVVMDALKRASAGCITAVVPYYAYARQDRKIAPRMPIAAKLVADLISAAGAHRLVTMDLHAGQIQGFFRYSRGSSLSPRRYCWIISKIISPPIWPSSPRIPAGWSGPGLLPGISRGAWQLLINAGRARLFRP